MKKIIAITLISVLLGAMAACGNAAGEPSEAEIGTLVPMIEPSETMIVGDFISWDLRQALLIDADNENGYFLYGLPGGESMLLIYHEPGRSPTDHIDSRSGSGYFEWDWLMPNLFMPEMKVFDIDGNGTNEVVIKVCVDTGTGTHTEDLHVIVPTKASYHTYIFTDYYFTQEDIQAQLDEVIKWQVTDEDNKEKALLTITDGKSTFNGNPYKTMYMVPCSISLEGGPRYAGYNKFEFDDKGVSFWASAAGVCNASARVNFKDGKFTLTDISIN